MRKVIITGGSGFIGSNLMRYWLNKYDDLIMNVDAMTYAARVDHVREYLAEHPEKVKRSFFELADIRDRKSVEHIVQSFKPDLVIHLAAESHVCRSIKGPEDFFSTNVMGTFNLMEECRKYWGDSKAVRFHHVSTDEVFGELKANDAPFDESNPLAPRSPYAASKAASDLLGICYRETYGFPMTISNCSNNFGPNQHEEKLIPKVIQSIVEGRPITLYGSGKQIRDWLYVDEHCYAIDAIIHKGVAGHRYCIGGEKEFQNIAIAMKVAQTISRVTGKPMNFDFVNTNERPTDDFRYAIDNTKITRDTGWSPTIDFDYALECTVAWYLDRMIGRGVGAPVPVTQGSGAV
jgi:dTDP-glucose 4,6-dehydratase